MPGGRGCNVRVPHGTSEGGERMRIIVIGAALVSVGLASPAALAQSGTHPWSGSVTPYLWLPSFSGTLRYDAAGDGGGRPQVDAADPHDYLEDLRFAFMLAGEVRKG